MGLFSALEQITFASQLDISGPGNQKVLLQPSAGYGVERPVLLGRIRWLLKVCGVEDSMGCWASALLKVRLTPARATSLHSLLHSTPTFGTPKMCSDDPYFVRPKSHILCSANPVSGFQQGAGEYIRIRADSLAESHLLKRVGILGKEACNSTADNKSQPCLLGPEEEAAGKGHGHWHHHGLLPGGGIGVLVPVVHPQANRRATPPPPPGQPKTMSLNVCACACACGRASARARLCVCVTLKMNNP